MSQNDQNKQKTAEEAQLAHQEEEEKAHPHESEEHEHNLDAGLEGENDDSKNPNEGKHEEGDQEHNDLAQEVHELDQSLQGDGNQTSEIDDRSVYVKSVDYSATKEEVAEFFKSCGKINRVTIITDKYTGNPKGYAYIEFADKEGAENATFLSESTFKGRTIYVLPKRTNVPHRGRGRGTRRFGRGYFPTIRRGYSMFTMRPMRRGFRPY